MGRKKRAVKNLTPIRPSRLPLIFKIAGVYFFTLICLVLLTLLFDIGLYQDALGNGATVWLKILKFYYYIFPWIIAFILGFLFRPFWPSFRNFLVVVLLLQCLYSLTAYFLHDQAIKERRASIHLSQGAPFTVGQIEHKYHDENHDGIIEQVELLADFEMVDFPKGLYEISADLSQAGTMISESDIGVYSFEAQKKISEVLPVRFDFEPQEFEPYFAQGPVDIHFSLKRIISTDAREKRVLALSRWSPFLRSTRWDGLDPKIQDEVISISDLDGTASLEILPTAIAKKPVVLINDFADYGLDSDGDGHFDHLVISMEVSSQYKGPIFIQAGMEGLSYDIYYENDLNLGVNQVTFVIDAEIIKEIGHDGPYALKNITLTNQDPQCHDDGCSANGEPFTVYLGNSLTQAYSLAEFFPLP